MVHYTRSIRAFATVLLLLLSNPVITQTVQSYWTVPDGSLGDFQQTFSDGETLPISWEGWGAVWTKEYLDEVTVADLWLTSYNYAQYQYSEFLTGNVNITQAGSYTWNIDINSTALANTAEYVLRFMPPQSKYNDSSIQISSSGFIVIQRTTTSTTTSVSSISTSIPTSITSTTSIPITITSSQIPTGTTTITSPSSGLSTGAKAGIGVGVSLGAVVVLLAILMFVYRRRFIPSSSPGHTTNPPEYDMVAGRDKPVNSSVFPYELPVPPAELDAEGHQ